MLIPDTLAVGRQTFATLVLALALGSLARELPAQNCPGCPPGDCMNVCPDAGFTPNLHEFGQTLNWNLGAGGGFFAFGTSMPAPCGADTIQLTVIGPLFQAWNLYVGGEPGFQPLMCPTTQVVPSGTGFVTLTWNCTTTPEASDYARCGTGNFGFWIEDLSSLGGTWNIDLQVTTSPTDPCGCPPPPSMLTCTATGPAGTASGDVAVQVQSMGALSPTLTTTFEYRTTQSPTWALCTAGMASPIGNPAAGVPAGMFSFEWDTVTDLGTSMPFTGVEVRATLLDSMIIGQATCTTATFTVDNAGLACTAAGPSGMASGDVAVQVQSMGALSPTLTTTFEYRTTQSPTWALCTAGMASPIGNPAAGVPAGMFSFEWDTVTDLGTSMPFTGVEVRATLLDAMIFGQATCTTTTFAVDNVVVAACQQTCGDCNLLGGPPDILDALTGAQISAGLVMPTMPQEYCCDVDSSGTVNILDALLMAQAAAGLPAGLTCP